MIRLATLPIGRSSENDQPCQVHKAHHPTYIRIQSNQRPSHDLNNPVLLLLAEARLFTFCRRRSFINARSALLCRQCRQAAVKLCTYQIRRKQHKIKTHRDHLFIFSSHQALRFRIRSRASCCIPAAERCPSRGRRRGSRRPRLRMLFRARPPWLRRPPTGILHVRWLPRRLFGPGVRHRYSSTCVLVVETPKGRWYYCIVVVSGFNRDT